jgi:putative transposase
MRKSRFSDEQIVAIVREAETGKPMEVCRRHGVSKETLRRWRAKYRGLELQEARRLKALEDENRRLKKLVADLALDNSLLKDLVGRKW